MRLAWFSPWPPDRSGVAGRSADAVRQLAARGHAIDVFVDERRIEVPRHTAAEPPRTAEVRVLGAHEFVWRLGRYGYDLPVYQVGNSRLHEYIWPYLLRWPGLAVLHDARVHHARARALLKRGDIFAYRAEFDAAWRHGGLWVAVWHPFATGRLSRCEAMDALIDHMKGKGGVWFATMEEIAIHARAMLDAGRWKPFVQELPYATAVVVDSIQEHAARDDVTVSATIYVERDSQKGIVVGKGGRRIKQIGQRGREAISQLFGCPVHVKLYVKVATNWSRVERGIRDMGYE